VSCCIRHNFAAQPRSGQKNLSLVEVPKGLMSTVAAAAFASLHGRGLALAAESDCVIRCMIRSSTGWVLAS